jgi:hypothetical protein
MMYQENPLRRSSGSENDSQSNDNEIKFRSKGQASNLGRQYEIAEGPLGLFGAEAQKYVCV